MGLVPDRDLPLLHDLEERALDLGRGAVDLVGEQEVGEHRAELGVEGAAVRAVDARADQVAGDEVRGELDPAERGMEDVGERLDREGLGEAGDALEEEMAAGEEGDEHPLEHRVLADDDPPDLVEDGLGGLPGVDHVVDPVAARARRPGRLGGRGRGGGRDGAAAPRSGRLRRPARPGSRPSPGRARAWAGCGAAGAGCGVAGAGCAGPVGRGSVTWISAPVGTGDHCRDASRGPATSLAGPNRWREIRVPE